MKAPTLAEHFQRAGIDRYPAFALLVQLEKNPFKSKMQKPSLCVHNQWYRLPHESGSWNSILEMEATLHYIRMYNLSFLHITSENRNEATSGGDEQIRLNLMQKFCALDNELAMAGKSMTGAL